ncbi:zinc-dependent metalloprotease [Lacipirellula sp.]|uniref:zinc-dependent metalloprotease n=1 Tax=Lacipirellula sp. TaxID=2691419 RepID=UPI003D12AE39
MRAIGLVERLRRGGLLSLSLLAATVAGAIASPAALAAESAPARPSKFKDFAEVTKDAKKIEGLFDLYQDEEHLYGVIKGGDFNQPFLAPMSIARGAASAGTALNFGEQWVVSFKRVGDRVQLIRKNLRYEAPKGTPLEKAVQQNYTDSVLMALPIVSDNAPGGGVLIDFGDIFLTNFANLPVGGLDRSRSSWHKVKGYPNNVELQVMVTFAGSGMGRSSMAGDSGTIDPRGVTMVLHYSLVKMPDGGYRPRFADQRVGHFLSATKDFGSEDPDTQFVRRINRWRLEKANPEAELSAPKKQIVWWVEDTVPHEYRPFVEEGILEWNKAFEKVGFRNALSVRWQNDRDEFDPEDVNYCTFRWITTPMTFAMSNLRSNPITGEMIDGDVIFDASWIRFWKQNHAYLVGSRGSDGGDDKDDDAIVAVGEIVSPIMAARYGYGLPASQQRMLHAHGPNHSHGGKKSMEVVPESFSSFQAALNEQAAANGGCAACQYSNSMQDQFRMAAIALAGRASNKDGKVPDELIGQVIKSIVMHEVGHSLGLRHNFRASAMLDLDEVHDTAITHEKGLVGSVMDYTPVNIALEGQKQGDYATTTLGPYDYWAIEYAYKQFSGSEKDELKKVAARSPETGLEYATDEDLYMSNDPRVNVYDLGSDTLEYAKQRIQLSNEVLKEMEKNLVKDGDSWARLRPAFLTVLNQYGDAAFLATQYIGGREISRDARGGENAHDPITPVSGKKQRDALKFIAKNILIDEPIPMRPELLRRVTTEHWYHWGADMEMYAGKVGIPYYAQVEAIQNIPLSEMFGSSARLELIESNEAMVDPDQKPLQTAEVFRTFTDAIWSDLKKIEEPEDGEDAVEVKLSKVRRNLQRRHLQYLVDITLGPKGYGGMPLAYAMFMGGGDQFPAESRSLARQHLKEIHRVVGDTLKNDEVKLDELSRAHLEEINDQLQKVLDAKFEAGGV